jgi:metal-responsive CopG/Arc/MetJ family transcriptional regulator
MSKIVSIRLSDNLLASLDEACRRLHMNRSAAVAAGIAALAEYVREGHELKRGADWLTVDLAANPHYEEHPGQTLAEPQSGGCL